MNQRLSWLHGLLDVTALHTFLLLTSSWTPLMLNIDQTRCLSHYHSAAYKDVTDAASVVHLHLLKLVSWRNQSRLVFSFFLPRVFKVGNVAFYRGFPVSQLFPRQLTSAPTNAYAMGVEYCPSTTTQRLQLTASGLSFTRLVKISAHVSSLTSDVTEIQAQQTVAPVCLHESKPLRPPIPELITCK